MAAHFIVGGHHGADTNKRLEKIDAGQVKRYSFNSLNGLWPIRMKTALALQLEVTGKYR